MKLPRPKKNKYNAVRNKHAGIWFDSEFEGSCYGYLKMRQMAGEIRELKHHPGSIYLSDAKIEYQPDFSWIENDGNYLWHGEAKGMETASWVIKKKLWVCYGPTPLAIFKGNAARPFIQQKIFPPLRLQEEKN